ncbi:thioesterase family protein [Salinithrix halophila]|uniref:Thioesterase family protein n=1 Tax=Salinithrix halophila TaxID=1485204 RepID=A0ABV8JF00_9BACL
MKARLQVGHRERLEVTVTREMTASFGGVEVHPVLSTVSMVYHMEWAGRKVILPFLEPGEEGVGGAISVEHRAPAPVGKVVTFTAEAIEVTSRKVLCRVWCEHDKALVGEGTFLQAILPSGAIRRRIEAMS